MISTDWSQWGWAGQGGSWQILPRLSLAAPAEKDPGCCPQEPGPGDGMRCCLLEPGPGSGPKGPMPGKVSILLRMYEDWKMHGASLKLVSEEGLGPSPIDWVCQSISTYGEVEQIPAPGLSTAHFPPQHTHTQRHSLKLCVPSSPRAGQLC